MYCNCRLTRSTVNIVFSVAGSICLAFIIYYFYNYGTKSRHASGKAQEAVDRLASFSVR
jgi:hypothetical protein